MTFQGELASESQLIPSQDPLSVVWKGPRAVALQPPGGSEAVWACTQASEGATCAQSGCQVRLCLSPGSCCAVSRERKIHGAGGLRHHFLRPVQMGARRLPFIYSQYHSSCPRMKACGFGCVVADNLITGALKTTTLEHHQLAAMPHIWHSYWGCLVLHFLLKNTDFFLIYFTDPMKRTWLTKN